MQFVSNLYAWLSDHARFQILSDLHLEVGRQYDTYQIPPSAPYLILAGDIGRLVDYESYLTFLTRHVDRFQLIFLVLGNHELYGLTLEEGIREADKLEREEILLGKVVFLHRKRYDILQHGIVVLGCTLWSHIPKEAEEIVMARVNDFKRINKWTIQDHNNAHQQDLEWLQAQTNIAQGQGQTKKRRPARIIAVTHHAPCIKGTSDPGHAHSTCSSAFATDVLNHFRGALNIWVFGHTHYSTDFMQNGIRVIANQRGYVLNPSNEAELRRTEKKKHKFNLKKVATV
ncbi:hypothetical protein M433DRAFT_74725 [Acidomyces richmondensis BFW]|nr:hypothetical protein M433DRAFT_74725 [Acidomyces richmondensis BFW]